MGSAGGIQLICSLNAILYMLPFYILPSLRASRSNPRDSPASIRLRSRAVWCMCIVCLCISYVIQTKLQNTTLAELWHRIGIWHVDTIDSIKCIFLLCILFAGPLFENLVIENWIQRTTSRQQRSFWKHIWYSIETLFLSDWVFYRNIIVGPVSEELIFRGLNISLMLSVNMDKWSILKYAPLHFGIAHIHHLNEFLLTHKRSNQSYISALFTPQLILPGIARSLFQFGYTTLFGVFVTFVFLRTGNLYSCILAHSFCNWMGLPRFWGRVGQYVGEEVVQINHESMQHTRHDQTKEGLTDTTPISENPSQIRGLSIHWSAAYYILLFAGAWGFYKLLFPLTYSKHSLMNI